MKNQLWARELKALRVPSCSKIAAKARLETVLGDSTWRNLDWESQRREGSPANRMATWKENVHLCKAKLKYDKEIVFIFISISSIKYKYF